MFFDAFFLGKILKYLQNNVVFGRSLEQQCDDKPNAADSSMDIAEIFSPPRVTTRARDRNLKGGWAMDRAFMDPTTGRKWDLSDPDCVKAAWRLYFRTKPKLLICTHFARYFHKCST